MKISEEALDEFIRLFQEEFKEDITRAEASEMAFRLMTLYETMSEKMPDEHKITPPDDPPGEPIGFRLR